MNMQNECSIKEEKQQRKLFRKINKIDSIIKFWNELEYVTHHTRKTTSTYRKIKQMLQFLMNGTFITKFPLAPKFIERIKIENVHHKYSMEEIKENLAQLSLLCSPGYSTSKYPHTPKAKGLDSLLYNSATNTSYFLLVEYNPPKLCGTKSINLDNLPFDDAYLELFLNLMSYEYKENKKDIEETAIGIVELIKFHTKYTFQNSTLDSLDNFLYIFKSYLRENYSYIKPYMIGNKTFVRQNFYRYLEQHYHERIEL